MTTPKAETCTQVEVMYYLQCQPDIVAGYWFNCRGFSNGFQREDRALEALNKVRELDSELSRFPLRIIRQVKVIKTETTIHVEVLDDPSI